MSRDEVNCSSIILSVVAECSVKVFDDVGVFVTECQFGVSGIVSDGYDLVLAIILLKFMLDR